MVAQNGYHMRFSQQQYQQQLTCSWALSIKCRLTNETHIKLCKLSHRHAVPSLPFLSLLCGGGCVYPPSPESMMRTGSSSLGGEYIFSFFLITLFSPVSVVNSCCIQTEEFWSASRHFTFFFVDLTWKGLSRPFFSYSTLFSRRLLSNVHCSCHFPGP